MRPRTALDIIVLWLEPERILRDIVNYIGVHLKYLLFLSDFNET
jgi:hypothetical protein